MQVVALLLAKPKIPSLEKKGGGIDARLAASADALDTDTGGISTGKVTHCRSVQEHPIGPGY